MRGSLSLVLHFSLSLALGEMRNGETRPIYMTEHSRAVSNEEAIRCRSPEVAGSGTICFSSLSPDFHEPWPESSFFSYSRRRETGRPLEDSEQCHPQFRASSLLHASRGGDTRSYLESEFSRCRDAYTSYFPMRNPQIIEKLLKPDDEKVYRSNPSDRLISSDEIESDDT